jgi:hypothetical protein
MRLYLDVKSKPEDRELLAHVDVTDMSEQERSDTLDDLKALHGAEATYYWHECHHDVNKPCKREGV